MKILILFLLFNSMILPQYDDFFEQTDKFLKANVTGGLVNYEKIIRNPDQLESIVAKIAEFKLKTIPDKNYKKALLINTYNLLVIKNVVDNYPVKNPLKVEGFFREITFDVGGKTVTLDNLEHDMLYPIDKDPRLHFVLVCAARGCPVLLSKAYKPVTLEEELNSKTKATLNDPRFVQVEDKSVYLSELFKWYKKDFGGTDEGLIEFLNKHRGTKLPENAEILYKKYDWSLNETRE